MDSAYLEFLYNLGLFNIKLGLSTIRNMLHRMGNPHHHPRIIHIAGTNGKGSTLATIERLLMDTGFSTGSTISPHLIKFNERFRINGEPVSDSELDKAFETVCEACDINLDLSRPESADGLISPTFFEFSIAMAFELFKSHSVDYIILETGLGGRLDATNVVENPIACVLTRIGYDHQEFLGETLEEITWEKMGILKKNTPVFVTSQLDKVKQIISYNCLDNNFESYFYPDNFNCGMDDDSNTAIYRIAIPDHNKAISKSEIRVPHQSLLGDHQKQNTATALAVYYSIVPEGRRLSNNLIIKSLQGVSWKGRLEYLDENKRILIDAAHNESAIKCLFHYLRQHHSQQRILFAIGWKKDKKIVDVIDLNGLKRVDFLPVIQKSENALDSDSVSKALKDQSFKTLPPTNVVDLVSGIKNNTFPGHDLLIVAGSIYLLGEFLEEWQLS